MENKPFISEIVTVMDTFIGGPQSKNYLPQREVIGNTVKYTFFSREGAELGTVTVTSEILALTWPKGNKWGGIDAEPLTAINAIPVDLPGKAGGLWRMLKSYLIFRYSIKIGKPKHREWRRKGSTPDKNIPSNLRQRLRETLWQCGPFDSNKELLNEFVDERLAPWRNQVPDNTSNRGQRVDALIHALHDKDNANDENALILFLHVLADRTPPTNACYQKLINLADKLNSL